MFMTRSLKVTPKTTEQHLVVRSSKSVAYVINNKRLRSTFCTIEAKLLTDTKHRAASLRQQSYWFGFMLLQNDSEWHNVKELLLHLSSTVYQGWKKPRVFGNFF